MTTCIKSIIIYVIVIITKNVHGRKNLAQIDMRGVLFLQKVGGPVIPFLSENRKEFFKVCRGHYGRRVIYSNVPEITKDNVISELAKAMSIHYQNRREIDYLYNYVSGNQPILYREKDVRPEIKNDIVENHALEIVRFQIAQSYGEPMQYVSVKSEDSVENKAISEEIDKLNNFMRTLEKQAYDVELGDWQSTCGTAYREVWSKRRGEVKDGEPLLGIDIRDPRDNFIIYSSRKGRPPLMSCSMCYDEKDQKYWLCTTDSKVFEVHGNKVTESANGHGSILLTEYPNNTRRLSDVEIVITILDGINKIQSNRVDGIEQFVQAFIKFVNCEIDEETFLKMCKIGALKVKTVNPSMPADVGMVSSQLDQQQTQVSKDDLYKNMLIIEGMPSREQNTGGDTGQAVYLRNGWDFAEQRAKIDEPITRRSEKQFLKVALNILKTKQQISDKLKISDIDVKINRNNTDNMMVKAQSLIYLLEKGIHPKIAIRTVGLWSDPEKIYLESKPYLDALYKTAEQMQNEGGDSNE